MSHMVPNLFPSPALRLEVGSGVRTPDLHPGLLICRPLVVKSSFAAILSVFFVVFLTLFKVNKA